ncbi:hypothetical protein ACIQ6V_31790 [Streptomyces sp. NPDC096198]|uniref:hypothetical protein n=1 Tax=Streptomyces sp. NPDC096198 TaxID=3366080 RepID=UPI0037F5FD30
MTEPRTTTHQAPLPLLRAAVFATVGTVLGVSARHLVAGGPVPWRQGAAAMAALLMVGLVGARRRRSLGVVVATCGLAQAWLHSWFMADHSDGRPESVRSGPAHMHHAVGAHEVWHERLHASSALTVAHAVAALLVGVLLHRGDTVCWSLARGLIAVVAAVRVAISGALALLGSRRSRVRFPAPLPAASWLDRPPPQGAVLADVIVRRGPPWAGLAFAF